MPVRSRREALRYREKQKDGTINTDCVFCKLHPEESSYLDETKSFMLVRNIFAYSTWDSQDVEDHIMVVPKKHIESLSVLSASEAVEFVGLIGSYESRGYNVYARAPNSAIKTIIHQHTHLIKAGKKRHRFIFYLRRPYIRLVR